ncbi:MAG: DNRLRE domain-containing protein [Chitinophagaceae bacterium]
MNCFSQIGIGTNTPDSSAQLDVYSTSKGFLPPRLALTATNVADPVTKPTTGLLVYNTGYSGSSPYNVAPGYYYWNGTAWYPVVNKANMPGDMQYWNGIKWITIPLGLNNQTLTICGGIPTWGSCPAKVVTIAPINNPFEGRVYSYTPTVAEGAGDAQLPVSAWTAGGSASNHRLLIRFDYSSIPVGSTIDSVKLFLYAAASPTAGGNGIDPHYGPTNACYIQRITSIWNTAPNPYTWNNQPTATSVNQAVIPQSTSSGQDNIIDVTNLVKDMLSTANNGFFIRLQNEVTYNIRQYASSFTPNEARRPKLVVYYR